MDEFVYWLQISFLVSQLKKKKISSHIYEFEVQIP